MVTCGATAACRKLGGLSKFRTDTSDAFQMHEDTPRITSCGISYIVGGSLEPTLAWQMLVSLLRRKSTMSSENNSPDTQERQDDYNAPETADSERMSRLANEFATRAKQRQLRYDEGHNIFTK
jgi:hypothetical protein